MKRFIQCYWVLILTIILMIGAIFTAGALASKSYSREVEECAAKGGKYYSGEYESICIKSDLVIELN